MAFFSRPWSSSSCPMSAQKPIISALYFSLIQDIRTEVSRPPEYARTIFMRRRLNSQRIVRAKGKINAPIPLDGMIVRMQYAAMKLAAFTIAGFLAASCVAHGGTVSGLFSTGVDG